jgi:hypothetical protein
MAFIRKHASKVYFLFLILLCIPITWAMKISNDTKNCLYTSRHNCTLMEECILNDDLSNAITFLSLIVTVFYAAVFGGSIAIINIRDYQNSRMLSSVQENFIMQ